MMCRSGPFDPWTPEARGTGRRLDPTFAPAPRPLDPIRKKNTAHWGLASRTPDPRFQGSVANPRPPTVTTVAKHSKSASATNNFHFTYDWLIL